MNRYFLIHQNYLIQGQIQLRTIQPRLLYGKTMFALKEYFERQILFRLIMMP